MISKCGSSTSAAYVEEDPLLANELALHDISLHY